MNFRILLLKYSFHSAAFCSPFQSFFSEKKSYLQFLLWLGITQVLLYRLKFQTHPIALSTKKQVVISNPSYLPPLQLYWESWHCLYIFLYSAELKQNIPNLLTNILFVGNPVNCIVLLDLSLLSYIMDLRPVLQR